MNIKSALIAATIALPIGYTGAAEITPTPDKSAFTVTNRTPESLLRDLSTDRPDLTESPYSVDAGWWQLEMDLVGYTRDHVKSAGTDVDATALSLAAINLKLGLTHNIDLQTVIESYTRVKAQDNLTGDSETISGFGDITSRLKINLWGNDGGGSALALMPFIKWPTNQNNLGNNYIEGGLIIPYARDLPNGWGLGVMTEIDVVRNEADSGYTADWLNTITVSHDLGEKLGFYLELTHLTTEGPSLATFDCGLTYGVNRHVQLDCGANIGLTDATEDLTLFIGLTIRY